MLEASHRYFHKGADLFDLEDKLRAHEAERTTGWLDTHPCDRDRIESARRSGSTARLDRPKPSWSMPIPVSA